MSGESRWWSAFAETLATLDETIPERAWSSRSDTLIAYGGVKSWSGDTWILRPPTPSCGHAEVHIRLVDHDFSVRCHVGPWAAACSLHLFRQAVREPESEPRSMSAVFEAAQAEEAAPPFEAVRLLGVLSSERWT